MDNNKRIKSHASGRGKLHWIIIISLLLLHTIADEAQGCVFHSRHSFESESEGVRFIRIREDLAVGGEVLTLRAFPRNAILLKGMDRSGDQNYFRLRDVNSTTIQVLLDKSLEDLVDRDTPQNLLKFKILCTSANSRNEEQSSFMTVTVYIEDINDHFPTFHNLPYEVEIDELTPVGSTVFQHIVAFDRDKPNTPNSDIQYSLAQDSTNGAGFFSLESPHRPTVILRKALDFDEGIRKFDIQIVASDRGTPVRFTNTTMTIKIKDNDDLPPKFTENVYRSKINEFSPLTGKHVRVPLFFEPPIQAFDQDSLNATLTYDLIAGNERRLFLVNPNSGMIFLEREIDLEEESLPGNTFVLQLEARQKENPQRRSVARIELEINDLNDNPPEFEVDLYNISIVENLPTGFSVLQVNAFDRDQGENAEFYYSIAEEKPSGAFNIDPRTGWITVREQALLDRETRPAVMMKVKAIEKVQAYEKRAATDGLVDVEITLLDSNDNTPEFDQGNLHEFKVAINAKLGQSIGHVHAKDPDEGRNGMILYELQKPRGVGQIPFKIDPQNGTIYVSGPLRKGRLALFVEASDQPSNPSERRFSLAVVTIEIVRENVLGGVDFIGAPYEFWVGEDVAVGTSVGQIKTTLDYESSGEQIMYDLLHSYADGVPFAVEERTGTVTVIRNLDNFNRKLYEFEAVATHYYNEKSYGQLVRRQSRSQMKVTSSGEVIEIDEGIISDSKNVLVTNVTVHVVSPDEEKGILLRGTTSDPIVFRVKENVAGAMIGRLLYNKNITRSKETTQKTRVKPSDHRKNRQMSSTKYNKNETQFNTIPRTKRNNRDTAQAEFTVNIAPSILFEDFDPQDLFAFEQETRRRSPRATKPEEEIGFGSRRAEAQARPQKQKPRRVYPSQALRKRYREGKKFEPITGAPPTTLALPISTYRPIGRMRVHNRNESIPVTEDVIEEVPPPKGISEMNPMNPRKLPTPETNGLRYLIANQQDVTDLITITNDGTLMTLKGLDREERDTYRLTIIAEYTRGHINGAGIYQVTIHVDDENDNPPVFNHPSYSGVISENSPLGTEVIINQPIMVSDKDIGKNAEVEISLYGEGSHLFKIELVNGTTDAHNKSFMSSFDTFTSAMNIEKNFANLHMMFMDATIASMTSDPHYIIRFVGPSILDRERENYYNLKMIARDKGGMSNEVKLGIFVADVNDNPPVFDKIAVFKNTGVKILEYTNDMEIYFVDQVEAKPVQLESQNNHTYSFKYEISPNPNPTPFSEGMKEMVDRYHIGTPRNIKLRNAKERAAPRPFTKRQVKKERSSSPLFAIMENALVGQSVLKVTASDEDDEGNAQVFYDILTETFIPRKSNGKSPSSNSSPSIAKYFHIDRLSGELRVNRLLPAESEIRLNISARDVGNLMDYTQIRFRVIDVNDHSPVFQKPWYTFDIEEGIYKNTRVGRVEALDEDYGQNANVTYRIVSEKKIPFVIAAQSGVITVNGDVDREIVSSYEFKVLATDNSEREAKLTAEAEIEITVLDLNDNAPEFTAYDELYSRRTDGDQGKERHISGEAFDLNQLQTPVYKAYINRNTEPGTFVKQVMAIDKDFAGNGNGLVMYSLHHNKLPYLFEIDSRDGIITTVSKLSTFHGYEHLNMTIIASDLGSPTKTSTALLLVNLQGEDVYEEEDPNEAAEKTNKVLPHKYYEVEVMENGPSPMKVLQMNVTKPFEIEQLKWSIVAEMDILKYDIFTIDQDNGTLWVNRPLDREVQDYYKLRIRAEKVSREGRNHPLMSMNYPVEGDRVMGLQDNEARVVIRVGDENDNSPIFIGNGRPIVAVIPSTANFGFPVTKVAATDVDAGLNAEIRYSLLNEPSKLFGIDPLTGRIRVLGPVNKGSHRVYGFDVKAVDRKGADDGKSSITNVFVYVLDENRQVRLVLSGKPLVVEKEVDNLTKTLSEATSLDVRVRMLEPHASDPDQATDVYLYAVDPKSNSVIDMGQLQDAIQVIDVRSLTPSVPIIEVAQLGSVRGLSRHSTGANGNALNGPELASIILSVIILAGGLATAFCIACVRYKRMRSTLTEPHYAIGRVPSTIGTTASKSTTTYSSTMIHAQMLPFSGGGVGVGGEATAGGGAGGTIKSITSSHLMVPTLATTTTIMQKPTANNTTNPLGKGNKYITHTRSSVRERKYIDVPLPKAITNGTVSGTNASFNVLDHDSACLRFNQLHTVQTTIDNSGNSIHSSGRDSGLDLSRERSESPGTQLQLALQNKQHHLQNQQLGRMQSRRSKERQSVRSQKCICGHGEVNLGSGESSDSYEDSLKGTTVSRRTSLPRTAIFRRSIRNNTGIRGVRHSFSGVRDDLIQQSPAPLHRTRGHGQLRNSITDLEERLRNLERTFREPYIITNSHC